MPPLFRCRVNSQILCAYRVSRLLLATKVGMPDLFFASALFAAREAASRIRTSLRKYPGVNMVCDTSRDSRFADHAVPHALT